MPPSRHLTGRGVPLRAKVDRLLLRCLEKDPARRLGSMEVLERELRNLACLTGAAARPPTPNLAAAATEDRADDEPPLPSSPAQVRELLHESIQELGRMALAQRAATEQMAFELSRLEQVDGAVRLARIKHEELVERVDEVRQGLREREARLRYAIIELSLTRDHLASGPGGHAQGGDLAFQVSELEQRLARLEHHRQGVCRTLGAELDRHQEEVDAEQERHASYHRRILGQIEAVRHRLSGEDAVGLYRIVMKGHGELNRPR